MKHRGQLDRVVKKQAEAAGEKNINLKVREASLLSLSDDAESDAAYVNLKYYRFEHECLSQWTAEELRSFSAFCRKMTLTTWTDIYKSGGGSGRKTGLGYSIHKDREALPKTPEVSSISPDLTWFELRVTQEARVHGFRCKSAFFLVFLDRAHQVYAA